MRKCYRGSRGERNIVQRITRKAKWFGHIWCRNCLLKHVTEENTEGRIKRTGRQGRRRNQLLVDHKERRLYCKLNGKPLASHPEGTHF